MVMDARGIGYSDVAKVVGISDVAVRKWVLHSKTFEWSRVKSYADAIGVEPMWLLTGYGIFSTKDGEEVATRLGEKDASLLKILKASLQDSSK